MGYRLGSDVLAGAGYGAVLGHDLQGMEFAKPARQSLCVAEFDRQRIIFCVHFLRHRLWIKQAL